MKDRSHEVPRATRSWARSARLPRIKLLGPRVLREPWLERLGVRIPVFRPLSRSEVPLHESQVDTLAAATMSAGRDATEQLRVYAPGSKDCLRLRRVATLPVRPPRPAVGFPVRAHEPAGSAHRAPPALICRRQTGRFSHCLPVRLDTHLSAQRCRLQLFSIHPLRVTDDLARPEVKPECR